MDDGRRRLGMAEGGGGGGGDCDEASKQVDQRAGGSSGRLRLSRMRI